MEKLSISERRACRVLSQPRTSQRYVNKPDALTEKIRPRVIELASKYGRYGYRKVTWLLNNEGIDVGKDRVYSIWKEEELKVPQKQPKRSRLWLVDGSCVRKRPEYKNHVWSYDFVFDKTHDGRTFKILNIIDEYTKECLCSLVQRKINSKDVILTLADLFLKKGFPKYIRSDNGPEFIAKELIKWLGKLNVNTLFIYPGSPWENGYVESFNGKMRYEILNGELFYTLKEAQVIIENWRREYNTIRPHQSLNGKPPAPETLQVNKSTLYKQSISM